MNEPTANLPSPCNIRGRQVSRVAQVSRFTGIPAEILLDALAVLRQAQAYKGERVKNILKQFQLSLCLITWPITLKYFKVTVL